MSTSNEMFHLSKDRKIQTLRKRMEAVNFRDNLKKKVKGIVFFEYQLCFSSVIVIFIVLYFHMCNLEC